MKLQNLWRELENMKMEPTDSVQKFLTKVSTFVNQIRSYGEDLKEQKVVEKVLRSLPAKYNFAVAAIEESKDLSSYTFVELMGSLQACEEQLTGASEANIEQAFHRKLI